MTNKHSEISTQILDYINEEIPFNLLKKNEGIFETNIIGDSDISIGVSYEDNEYGEEVYIYNIFVGDEYVNISSSSTGTVENRTPEPVIDEMVNVIAGFCGVKSI